MNNISLISEMTHVWHLFVIRLQTKYESFRDKLFNYLRQNNIGVNVHYIPIHKHPFYQNKYNFENSGLSVTEDVYNKIITLPLFPEMNKNHIDLIADHLFYFFENEI